MFCRQLFERKHCWNWKQHASQCKCVFDSTADFGQRSQPVSVWLLIFISNGNASWSETLRVSSLCTLKQRHIPTSTRSMLAFAPFFLFFLTPLVKRHDFFLHSSMFLKVSLIRWIKYDHFGGFGPKRWWFSLSFRWVSRYLECICCWKTRPFSGRCRI